MRALVRISMLSMPRSTALPNKRMKLTGRGGHSQRCQLILSAVAASRSLRADREPDINGGGS